MQLRDNEHITVPNIRIYFENSTVLLPATQQKASHQYGWAKFKVSGVTYNTTKHDSTEWENIMTRKATTDLENNIHCQYIVTSFSLVTSPPMSISIEIVSVTSPHPSKRLVGWRTKQGCKLWHHLQSLYWMFEHGWAINTALFANLTCNYVFTIQ